MTALLSVTGLEAAYGDSQVLFGLDLEIEEGQAVALLGRNGMGKTTTVRSIIGMVRPKAGTVRFAGVDMAGQPSYRIARAGIGLVPEGRQIFPNLSVVENLVATAARRNGGGKRWTLSRVFDLFPRLAERRSHMGNQLSGGEQQMLAIGRALMTNPRLLILDEATEGLAPLIRKEIWSCLGQLRSEALAILVVDKNVDALMRLADRHAIIEKGHMVWTGTSADLAAEPDLRERYLSV